MRFQKTLNWPTGGVSHLQSGRVSSNWQLKAKAVLRCVNAAAQKWTFTFVASWRSCSKKAIDRILLCMLHVDSIADSTPRQRKEEMQCTQSGWNVSSSLFQLWLRRYASRYFHGAMSLIAATAPSKGRQWKVCKFLLASRQLSSASESASFQVEHQVLSVFLEEENMEE